MTIHEVLTPNVKRNLMWEELKIRVDHYKYYLNMALQANAFFYVIAGGVLGFYLKGPDEKSLGNHPDSHLEFLLLLPILIGIVLSGLFFYGALLQIEASKHIEEIKKALNDSGLQIKDIPDVNFLQQLLIIFGCILFIVSVSLIFVPDIGPPTDPTNINGNFKWIAGIIVVVGVLLTSGAIIKLKLDRVPKSFKSYKYYVRKSFKFLRFEIMIIIRAKRAKKAAINSE